MGGWPLWESRWAVRWTWYGALFQYLGMCVSGRPAALLDINNNLPKDLYENQVQGRYPYGPREIFLGFHCGNTAEELMCAPVLKYKLNRKDPHAPETGLEETRGTYEGAMAPGEVSCFRLHATAEGRLQAYVARGETLPLVVGTDGCYAPIGIKGMDRFYRHVFAWRNTSRTTAPLSMGLTADSFMS